MPVILNPDLNIAFVHIPKCAGTTIRKQLRSVDATFGYFEGIKTAPNGATLDHMHLTLAELEAHYPESYRHLLEADSFALVRDPAQRFISGVLENLRSVHGVTDTSLSHAALEREMIRIAKRLDRGPLADDAALAHFKPQSSFVFHDRRQVITELYPLERVDILCGEMARRTGLRINARRRSKASFMARSTAGRCAGAFMRKPLGRLAAYQHSGAMMRAASRWICGSLFVEPKDAIPAGLRRLAQEVADRHYAEDGRLHLSLLRRHVPAA